MRILYVTTIGITMNFFKDLIKTLIDEGHTVDIACNEDIAKVPQCYFDWKCRVYHIETSRSPIKKGNLIAIKKIKEIVREGCYDIVHCHTPIASMCTRIACRKLRKKGIKVIYTAHGFHFYKGAAITNWLIYFPIEWICSWWTDILITINQEDYERAKYRLHARKVSYVPGVGINLEKFEYKDGMAKRNELGVDEKDLLFLSVGELNSNKNHEMVIRAIKEMKCNNIKYFICGVGALESYLVDLINELDLQDRVQLLGFRTDINELYQASDLCVFPSRREGLPVALMEAIACKVPVICSNIRGNVDLVNNERFRFGSHDLEGLQECLRENLYSEENSTENICYSIGKELKDSAETNYARLKMFELNNVIKIMLEIYIDVNLCAEDRIND